MSSNQSHSVIPVVIDKKTSGTMRIFEIFLVLGVLTIMGIIAFKIVGGTTGSGSCTNNQVKDPVTGNCHDPCPDGTTYVDPYGCLSCDPTTDPSCNVCPAGTECGANGSCQQVGSGSVCTCTAPYFGKLCDKVCTADGNQCQNGGTCLSNGTCKCTGGSSGPLCAGGGGQACSKDVCALPGCTFDGTDPNNPKCECVDGWTSSGDDTKWCDICVEGRGPKGDCTKKQFPPKTFNRVCRPKALMTNGKVSAWCQQVYGSQSAYTIIDGEEYVRGFHCPDDTQASYWCDTKIPYWANATGYDPDNFPVDHTKNADQLPPGFQPTIA